MEFYVILIVFIYTSTNIKVVCFSSFSLLPMFTHDVDQRKITERKYKRMTTIIMRSYFNETTLLSYIFACIYIYIYIICLVLNGSPALRQTIYTTYYPCKTYNMLCRDFGFSPILIVGNSGY